MSKRVSNHKGMPSKNKGSGKARRRMLQVRQFMKKERLDETLYGQASNILKALRSKIKSILPKRVLRRV